MKIFFLEGVFLTLFLVGCAPEKDKMITCDLTRTDYLEIIQAKGTLQAVRNASIMAPREYYGNLTVGYVLPEGTRVEAGDTICILKCPEMTQILDDYTRKLESLKVDLIRQESSNAMSQAVLEAQVKENIAGMSVNQLDSIQMQFAPPVKKRLMALELEKSRVEQRKLQKKVRAQKAIDEAGIRQLRSRIIQAENEFQVMQEKVKGLTVISPSAGILTASMSAGRIMMESMDGSVVELGTYPKVDAFIYPELPLMSLPDLTELEVKAEVPEVDYKRIEKGQKVDMSIEAGGGIKTTGTVKSKSLAAKMQYSGAAKYKYYELILSVDSCHTRMVPGLSAECTIIVNQIRDTMVVPTMAIYTRDSLKVVYVAEKDMFHPVPVETGPFNSAQTLVTSGLKGSETISLTEPPANRILK